MKVCIVGTGYVGLVTGVCLAAKGHDVTCVDQVAEKVDSINRGVPPIHEAGLEPLLSDVIRGSFRATTDLRDAVSQASVTIIAVGTPYVGDSMDSSYLEAASAEIGDVLATADRHHVVVVKSTVVPGTTDTIVAPILEERSGKKRGADFGIAMNPEFLREGNAIEDFMDPDRIVIGADDVQSTETLADLYSVFSGAAIITTTVKTAEMIKYTSNALLATLISFSNEIANLSAEIANIDVVDVMRGVHADKRISPMLEDGRRVTPGIATYIEAGCGFGGSCFPKDVKALIAHGRRYNQSMQLLSSVIEINEQQPRRIIEILERNFRSLDKVKVAVLGLAFKPGTDDMRESPSIPVVQYLIGSGAAISAFDPIAMDEAKKLFPDEAVRYCDSVADAIEGADAIVLMTRWSEFEALPDIIEHHAQSPLVVDGRRMLAKDSIPRYEGIGLRETA